MAAGVYDIEVPQNSTFDESFTYYDESEELVQMSGWTAVMQVRPATVDASAEDNDDPVFSLDPTGDLNGTITLGATDGTIRVQLSRDELASVEPATYKYDILLVNSDDAVDPFLKGKFKIAAGVTTS